MDRISSALLLVLLISIPCSGCNQESDDPIKAAVRAHAAETAKLRQQLSKITVEDSVSQSEAEIIAAYYFNVNVGCGGFTGIRDGGLFWIVEARYGIAATPVNGFHIDKKSGKISSPIGPSYASPTELLR